ncbi:MAG: 1,3-beta-galactosyl-N-acetylhexosamine phosphorylase N-terminal domain-containing protein [Planctomycetota bacterium]
MDTRKVERGFVTLPGEAGQEQKIVETLRAEPVAPFSTLRALLDALRANSHSPTGTARGTLPFGFLELAEKWGADAIRDSDGTVLSHEIQRMGYDIYSTICLVRADQNWPQKHRDKLPQKFLMSSFVTATSTVVEIDLLADYFREKYELDGPLCVECPQRITEAFDTPLLVDHKADVIDASGNVALSACGSLSPCCTIQTSVTFSLQIPQFAILLSPDDTFQRGYRIFFDVARNRILFQRQPDQQKGGFSTGLERPVDLNTTAKLDIRVILDGTVCEIYAAGKALSARMYDFKPANWAFFACRGLCQLSNVFVHSR